MSRAKKPHGQKRRKFRGDQRDLLRAINRAGLRTELDGGGHIKVHCPRAIVAIPLTPSDHRSIHNVVTRLRHAGFDPGAVV